MRASHESPRSARGFTLLEMTIVIMMLLALMGTGLFATRKYDDWKLGRQAGETLRTVWSAQRTFLADSPTKLPSAIVAADLLPYLPGPPAALPTVKSLTGANLQINITAVPPHAVDGGGARYDPSGKHNDLLWDVGELGVTP